VLFPIEKVFFRESLFLGLSIYIAEGPKAKAFRALFSLKSKRWKVERTFSWLKRKRRRLLMRWERKAEIWEAITVLGLTYMWMENLVG